MKNKPHPRWVQTGGGSTSDFEKWASRSHRAGSELGQDPLNSNAPSPPSSLSDKSEAPSPNPSSTRSSSLANTYPSTILLSTGDRRRSKTASSSPQSTPSPVLVTPTDEFARSHISVTAQPDVHQEYDLTSMFLSYPGLMGCDTTSFGTLGKEPVSGGNCFLRSGNGHCGCLHEAQSYNVLLELSLRLRRAADTLSRSASHQLGQQCQLHQRIADLDDFTTYAFHFAPFTLSLLNLIRDGF